ncbi:MAG: hypothetical protein JW734_07275 [Candidatus Omnitrophica bacterium]|nr:hypothetical protein [Candidatus Omnitrophota bacterium]
MPDTKIKIEKRKPIICETCGVQMVFADEVLKSIDGRNIYLKYVCPHRAGEPGCGRVKAVPFAREPDVRLRRTRESSFVEA